MEGVIRPFTRSSWRVTFLKKLLRGNGKSSTHSELPVPRDTFAREASNGISFNLARHDRHNLEIKTKFETHQQHLVGQLSLYFVLPRSFRAKDQGLHQLQSDFHSRLRKAISDQQSGRPLDIDRSLSELSELLSSDRSPASKDLIDHCRGLGAVVAEQLKRDGAETSRTIFFIHSISSRKVKVESRFKSLRKRIKNTAALVRRIHEIELQLHPKEEDLAYSLGEYVHYLYIHFLAIARGELKKCSELENFEEEDSGKLKEKFEKEWAKTFALLSELQKTEAEYYRDFGRGEPENDLEREEYLYRIGCHKKFFQSHSFLEFKQKSTLKNFSEPIASASAVIAALCAALVQQWAHSGWGTIGSGGLYIIALGILLYTLRDRLKDRGKTYVNRFLGKRLPQSEKRLFLEGREIGRMREWIKIQDYSKLGQSVCLEEPTKQGLSDSYLRDQSDVLALSRIIELQNVLDHEHAVLEVLRVNLRRYLKFMDDPIKEISFLDEEGNVCFHKTKKVYHVYVGINWEPKCGHPIFQNYKIVLNKKGIQRVELLAS